MKTTFRRQKISVMTRMPNKYVFNLIFCLINEIKQVPQRKENTLLDNFSRSK